MPVDVQIVTHKAARLPKSVVVDGHDLSRGCHKATVEYGVDGIPQVTLVLHGRDVTVEHDADS